MYLRTPNNCQNKQNCSRPKTKDGKLTDYAKILLVVKHNNEGWNRIDLIKTALPGKWKDHWSDRAMCQTFAAMSANELLEYNSSDRKWYQGRNFKQYMDEYLFGEIA